MVHGKDPSPKLRLHKGMFRGLTAAEIEGLVRALAQESRDLSSAESINRVMLADIESQLRTTQHHMVKNKENIAAIKKALIVILEEYRHAIRRMAEGHSKIKELQKSQRRLSNERTQINDRTAAVSEAIRLGHEAAARASPIIAGRFGGRSETPSD